MKHTPLLLLTLLFPFTASAALFHGSESVYFVEPILDDTYITGHDVTVRTDIDGDALIVGGSVNIEGSIADDLSAAAGDIDVRGNIGDDLRLAGGQVRISSTVADHSVVVGGNVDLTPESSFERDVHIVGGNVATRGVINGHTTIKAGEAYIFGVIHGDVHIEAEKVRIAGDIRGESTIIAKHIIFEDTAQFRQNVRYWSKDDAVDFASSLQPGAIAIFDQELAPYDFEEKHHKKGYWIVGFLLTLLAGLILAAIVALAMLLFSKTFLQDTAKKLSKEFWPSFFIGLIYLLFTPLFCVLLAITIIGIPFAILIGVLYAFSLFFAKIITAVVLAKVFQVSHKKKWSTWQLLGVSLLIYIALKLVGMVPVIGWIGLLVAVASAYGALMSIKWQRLQKMR